MLRTVRESMKKDSVPDWGFRGQSLSLTAFRTTA
jgi:hypothetical protein